MSNSKIQETLAAALPFKEAGQPKASESAFPDVYAWNSTPAAQSLDGVGNSGNVAQVLQSTLKEASDAVIQSSKQLADLQSVQQQLLATTGQNTQALNANTTAKGGSGSDVLSTIGNVASGIFGQGSVLAPIASGIMGLFGKGASTPQPQVFTPFISPPSVQMETTAGSAVPAQIQPSPTIPSGVQGSGTPGPLVHIQVNAMDSRSFLDHSSEIADAVRHALLNSHSLGDVIAEL